MTPGERCAAIERAITQLVREAPALDAAVRAELAAHLGALGALDQELGAPLARSIARIVELVAQGQVAQGIALPHLAMACATLADGVAGRLSERELEAARYEIDTLLPVPGAPGAPGAAPGAAPAVRIPDVPLASLTRGPGRRT
ncbi:MAG TPA: hypothetical protein VNO30_14545 [Kofleriaceae bacterium]|nr:hypothetical protein [Kofleriaceae bacterium]